MIQNVDIGYFIISIIGLWLLAEIWTVLKHIRKELKLWRFKNEME